MSSHTVASRSPGNPATTGRVRAALAVICRWPRPRTGVVATRARQDSTGSRATPSLHTTTTTSTSTVRATTSLHTTSTSTVRTATSLPIAGVRTAATIGLPAVPGLRYPGATSLRTAVVVHITAMRTVIAARTIADPVCGCPVTLPCGRVGVPWLPGRPCLTVRVGIRNRSPLT
ncbi:hypothetical protein [Nocardia sputi]|uniref:hypothetical protein n=1 Tax=Nocardia sputi TaxID=2943705 RepID=UPI0020BECE98|nr:hypothetical protein [Nocardia sputi]